MGIALYDEWEVQEQEEREELKEDIAKEKKLFSFSKEFNKKLENMNALKEKLEALKKNLEQRKRGLEATTSRIEELEASMSKALELGDDKEVEKAVKAIQKLQESQNVMLPAVEMLEERTIPKAEATIQDERKSIPKLASEELGDIVRSKWAHIGKRLEDLNREIRSFNIAYEDVINALGTRIPSLEDPIASVTFGGFQAALESQTAKAPTASGNNDLAPYV